MAATDDQGPGGGSPAPNEHAQAGSVLRSLCDAGAKLVCIDFDATFVSVHTGGTWAGTPEDLRRHVRELFLALVPMMCAANIHVAVVTFSPQVELVRAVLEQCFDASVVGQLIVRCDDSSWTLAATEAVDFLPKWQVCGMHVDRTYKLPYVISAAIQASAERGETIRNRDTVLIDDDAKNIRIANDNGITGIYFEPDGADVEELCKRIRKLHTTAPTSSCSSALQTPCKRTTVRILATPEPAPRPCRTSRLLETPQLATMPRPKKFSLCTPSPVMKFKTTVDMGRPRSKKAARVRLGPRSISEELYDHPTGSSLTRTISAPSSPPCTVPMASLSPRSPDSNQIGRFSLHAIDDDDDEPGGE